MRFKVGDKVDLPSHNHEYEVGAVRVKEGVNEYFLVEDKEWWPEEDLEHGRRTLPKSDPLAKKIEERNHKTNSEDNLLNEDDPIKPSHYKTGDKDLFDEWYERYYHSDKTYAGREVFIEIMKSVAERYARRYPNKNDEDISKAIYTLSRLKEYEELEEEE